MGFSDISVHCREEDGYGIVAAVLFPVDANNVPSAEIWFCEDKDNLQHFKVFLSDIECPAEASKIEISAYKTEISDYQRQKLLKWLEDKPVRCYSINDKNNYEAMRTSWFSMKEIADNI